MQGEFIEQIRSLPGVELVDPVRIMPWDALGLRIFVISNDSTIYMSRGTPLLLAGKLPDEGRRAQGAVIVSENLARRRTLTPGSTFTMNTPTGVHTFTVDAVIIDYTSDQGSVIIDRKVFDQVFQDTRVDSFHVYVKDRARDTEPVRAAITAKLGRRFNLYVLSNAELRDEARKLIANAFSVTTAMELVAVILALLGVINTLLAAVLDRTREIGLLRAVGADRGHIIKLFAAEAALIGITGGVMGVAIGGVVGVIVTTVVGVQATGWDFPFLFPWQIALQMFVAASVCAILAGLYPARRASRLDVVEALAWE
jgi:putative ABC transport system permease protein